MDIPTKEEIMREWATRDTIVYACLHQQYEQGWTDEELWRTMVALMCDRHARLEKVAQDALAHSAKPSGPFLEDPHTIRRRR